MALVIQPYNSTEEIVFRTNNGFNIFIGGDIYQQYGSTTAIANTTTETSLLKPASQASGITGNAYVTTTALPSFPPGTFGGGVAQGVVLYGRVKGTIANTGTPTLRTRVVLKNSAGTIVYTLADSTATAMTTVSTVDFDVNFEAMVASVGTAGSIVGSINHRYATTTVYSVPAAVTVDTTQSYSIDVLLTWSAASASNTATAFWATIGVK